MAEHHSWVWQRRTLLAVAIAAASYTLGLMLPFKQVDRQNVASNPAVELGDRAQAEEKSDAESLTVAEAKVFDDLVTRISRLEAEQKRIYSYSLPQQFQGKTINNVAVPGDRKVIALTFDDGPWPKSTNDVLYILKKYDIKATFFLLGRNVQNFPNLAKQIVNHGHVVANHSWSHPYHQHSSAAAAQQLDRTDEIIYKVTGVKSVMFRPPGGYLNNGLATYAAKNKNNLVVMWSADSQDYRASGARQIHNVLRDAGTGGIVLMHDGGGDRTQTVRALPVMIEKLKQQGYEFVTMPELLEIKEQSDRQKQQAQASQQSN